MVGPCDTIDSRWGAWQYCTRDQTTWRWTVKTILVLTVTVMLLGASATAGATMLSDLFGVSLSVNGAGAFNNSWAPVSATADYFVDDNWSTYFARTPHGGELFDIEAIYFDNDANYAYMAVVTSLPMPVGGYFLGEMILPGDMGVNLGDEQYDVGIDVDEGTGVVADVVLGDWYQTGLNYNYELGPTNFDGGVPLGLATVNYYDYGLVERGYDTYVFEIKVPRSALRNPMHGDSIGLTWSMGCRNDVITLDGTFDGDTVVPEPTTLLLLGSGLVGMVGAVRRRRK